MAGIDRHLRTGGDGAVPDGPRASSQVVVRTLTESFERVSDATSHIMLLALVAGLVSLAIGLPTRRGDELANSVLEDLLAAQVAVLLAALGFAFVAESIRCAADIVDDQSMMLAWPWSLIIACVSWMLATTIGPFETTRMLTILLNEWLPAMVDGTPRAEVIGALVPSGARWWAAFGPLPIIAAVWAFEAWRRDGFTHVREFLDGDDDEADRHVGQRSGGFGREVDQGVEQGEYQHGVVQPDQRPDAVAASPGDHRRGRPAESEPGADKQDH